MNVIIEVVKAENGFVLGVYPETEKGKAKYYIAKDSQELAGICKSIADQL